MANDLDTQRRFRYSGIIPEDDPWHAESIREAFSKSAVTVTSSEELFSLAGKTTVLVPPFLVIIGNKAIPQWSRTIAEEVNGFRPANDCHGNFTPYKFQPNNNCYNYACNIATNSFAQPGRLQGFSIMCGEKLVTAKVKMGAELDGLLSVGDASLNLVEAFKSVGKERGHLVALFLSEPDDVSGWRGDYHWVRCDHPDRRQWSHKSGYDQASNLDFKGHPIVDPTKSVWKANQGPDSPASTIALLVEYTFAEWMFVPFQKVNII